MRNEIYHDVWIRGNIVRNGDRPCPDRFRVIQNFLQRYLNPIKKFRVLDFGANMGYFSYNTAYEFPNADVTLVDYEPLLPCIHQLNGLPNTELIHQFMNTEDIRSLLNTSKFSFIKTKPFDVCYVMSVLHHFENFEEIIDMFIEASDSVIFEVGYPEEVPEVNVDRVRPIYEYIHKYNPIQINRWIYHDRPMYYVNKNEQGFEGTVHAGAGQASRLTFPAIEYQLQHTFKQEIFPGTLNVRLDNPIELRNYFYVAEVYRIYPAYLNGLPVYIIQPGEEKKVQEVEIISPYKLRDKFNLIDGSKVTISLEKRYLG
jgi:SAM-dependent methyltransferase